MVGYYVREFPAWKEDASFMLGEPGGQRRLEQTPERVRTVEIRGDSVALAEIRNFPAARTLIRYSVLYGKNLPTVATC